LSKKKGGGGNYKKAKRFSKGVTWKEVNAIGVKMWLPGGEKIGKLSHEKTVAAGAKREEKKLT